MMRQIEVENRMVVDSQWEQKESCPVPTETEEGYRAFSGNVFVPIDEAFDYAMDKCLNGSKEDREAFISEFKDSIVEWFFSGNWVKEE